MNFRPLLFAAVGSVSGIAAFEAVNGLQLGRVPLAALLSLIALSAGMLFLIALRKGSKAAAVFLAAFLLSAARIAAVMPDNAAPGEHVLRGTVCAVSETRSNVVTVSRASLDGEKLVMKVKLTLDKGDTPAVGDLIEVKCTVRQAANAVSGYDERHILLASGISVIARGTDFTVLSRHNLPLTEKLLEIKSVLHDRIYELFNESAPIAAGFILGEKSGIDEADIESFRQTGTAHLLTLSGFHVAILTAILFFALPRRFPWMRLVLVSLFLFGYCAITAFSPSLVRASVMCFMLMLADVAQERRDPLSSLSLAAILILFISPYKLWSAGFRLSFAATFGIILATGTGRSENRNRALGRFVDSVTAAIGATAASSLICAQYFGYFPTYGLLANITAVTVFSPAIAISFAALITGVPFPAIGSLAAWPARLLIGLAMKSLEHIKALPYSTLSVFSPSTLSFLLMLLLMFCVSLYVLRPLKKRAAIALPVFFLFTASLVGDIIRA